jgi:hypothetical protein
MTSVKVGWRVIAGVHLDSDASGNMRNARHAPSRVENPLSQASHGCSSIRNADKLDQLSAALRDIPDKAERELYI